MRGSSHSREKVDGSGCPGPESYEGVSAVLRLSTAHRYHPEYKMVYVVTWGDFTPSRYSVCRPIVDREDNLHRAPSKASGDSLILTYQVREARYVASLDKIFSRSTLHALNVWRKCKIRKEGKMNTR